MIQLFSAQKLMKTKPKEEQNFLSSFEVRPDSKKFQRNDKKENFT